MAVEAKQFYGARGRNHCTYTSSRKQCHGTDATAETRKQCHGTYTSSDPAPTPHVAVAAPCFFHVAPATATATAADPVAAPLKLKRPRQEEEEETQFIVGAATKRRAINVHPAVLHHVQKLSAEVQHWRWHAAAVNASAAGQLSAKDEETNAARRHNALLQEQMHAARAHALAFRDAAAAREAKASALRAGLDHALRRARAQDEPTELTQQDAAESYCCGSNDDDAQQQQEARTMTRSSSVAGACRGCGGDRDAAVVLLPCRHLSACAPCAAALRACPACGTPKAGSVAVNLVVQDDYH